MAISSVLNTYPWLRLPIWTKRLFYSLFVESTLVKMPTRFYTKELRASPTLWPSLGSGPRTCLECRPSTESNRPKSSVTFACARLVVHRATARERSCRRAPTESHAQLHVSSFFSRHARMCLKNRMRTPFLLQRSVHFKNRHFPEKINQTRPTAAHQWAYWSST